MRTRTTFIKRRPTVKERSNRAMSGNRIRGACCMPLYEYHVTHREQNSAFPNRHFENSPPAISPLPTSPRSWRPSSRRGARQRWPARTPRWGRSWWAHGASCGTGCSWCWSPPSTCHTPGAGRVRDGSRVCRMWAGAPVHREHSTWQIYRTTNIMDNLKYLDLTLELYVGKKRIHFLKY